MPTTTIHVQHGDGTPVRRVRVRLEFRDGFTDDVYTDDRGEAVVEHRSTDQAVIYVSGKKYHSMHAPGRSAVTVR
jgi:hypothetical protein